MLSGGAGLDQPTILVPRSFEEEGLGIRGYQPTRKKFNEIMEKIKAKVEITH